MDDKLPPKVHVISLDAMHKLETDLEKAIREVDVIVNAYRGRLYDESVTWFYGRLLQAIGRADSENLDRLRKSYPEAVWAYLFWRRTGRAPTMKDAEESF